LLYGIVRDRLEPDAVSVYDVAENVLELAYGVVKGFPGAIIAIVWIVCNAL
jgi:hypothetical protein